MSWDLVRSWRDRLRRADPTAHRTGLSPEGAREAWSAALDALDDASLAEVARIPGRPFARATFVAASTVVTAPIEWLAVLLGRGTAVTLKHPAASAGVAPLLADAAVEVGLPLRITSGREAVRDAELVVAMGSDESVRAIRDALPVHVRFLPHGHRFSAVWIASEAPATDPLVPEGFRDAWGTVAADAALHDGRGCLSPQVVLTRVPLEAACERLAAAMARAEARWPRGEVADGESATIRARRALAKVAGLVREGDAWCVHGLPADRWTPGALPRVVTVVQVPDAAAAAAVLAPWGAALSTVGTDDPASADAFVAAGATRICGLGRMQRPPLVRPHDGEDWLRATLVAIDLGTR